MSHKILAIVHDAVALELLQAKLLTLPNSVVEQVIWGDTSLEEVLGNGVGYDFVLLGLPATTATEHFRLVEYLSKRLPQAPIIVLTEQIEPTLTQSLLTAGAQDYLSYTHFDEHTIQKVLLFSKERQTLRSRFKKVANDYKQLFDINPMPMWVYSPERDTFIKVNDAACEKYGYSPKEFCQLKYKDIVQDPLKLNLKIPSRTYEAHRTKKGETLFVEITAHATSYKGQEAILTLIHDITNRIMTDYEQKKTSDQLRAIFDNATDAILLSDDKGRILEVNQAAIDLFEHPKQTILRTTVQQFVVANNANRGERLFSILHDLGKFRGKVHINSFYSQTKIVQWRAVANIRAGIHLHILSDITETELKAQEDELNSMILASIKDSYTLKETLSAIGNNIRMFTDWKLAEFWMPDAFNQQLFLASSSVNASAFNLLDFVVHSQNRTRKFDERSLPILSWKEKKGFWFDDLSRNPNFSRAELLDNKRVYTGIAVPILENPNTDDILGVLLVMDDAEIPYDHHLMTILSNVAASLGSIILKVKAREEMLNLFNYSADLICIADKKGNFVKTNPAFTKVLGYSAATLRKHAYIDFVHEDDLEASLAQVQKLYEGDIIYAHSNRYRTANNEYRDIEWVAVPDPNEKQAFVIGRDVTELKSKTAEALRHAEAVTTTLESITDGFFTVDKNWVVNYWNASAERMFKQSREAIIGKNLWEYFDRNAAKLLYDKLKEAIQHNTSVYFEKYFPQFDLWIEASVYPSTEGLSVYFKDITINKKQSLALLRAQKHQEAIINSTNDAIWTIDATGKLSSANQAYFDGISRLLGEQVTYYNEKVRAKFASEAQLKWSAWYAKAFEGESHSVVEEVNDIGGHFIGTFIINFNPIRDDEGKVTGVACFAKDITELNEKIALISQQKGKLDQIAWSQSHLVRAPLARIMFMVEAFNCLNANEYDQMQQLLGDLNLTAQELDSIIKNVVETTQN